MKTKYLVKGNIIYDLAIALGVIGGEIKLSRTTTIQTTGTNSSGITINI